MDFLNKGTGGRVLVLALVVGLGVSLETEEGNIQDGEGDSAGEEGMKEGVGTESTLESRVGRG